jgi:hypothetical protein
LVKAPWKRNFAYHVINFEPDYGLESHTTGNTCSQSQATPLKNESGSNETHGTSIHREENDRLRGIEEYKENLKKQEQSLIQQLEMLKVGRKFEGPDRNEQRWTAGGKTFCT